jgi:hypothetical protein
VNELSIVNEPVKFILAGREIALRLLSTAKRRAIAQAWTLGCLIEEIKDKARLLYPDDTDKALAYIQDHVEKLPQGQALADEIAKVSGRTELLIKYIAAASSGTLTEAEAERLVIDSSREELAAVMSYLYHYGRRVWLPASVWEKAIRLIAERYGYTPDQVADFMDVVLVAMLPELTAEDADKKRNAAIGRATEMWKQDHPNAEKPPDFFADITPYLIRISNEEQKAADAK